MNRLLQFLFIWSVVTSTDPHHCTQAKDVPAVSVPGGVAFAVVCSTAPIYRVARDGKPVFEAFQDPNRDAMQDYVDTMNALHPPQKRKLKRLPI